MKQFVLILCMLPFLAVAQAPADSTKAWTKGGVISVNFSQVSLSNWAAGGQSSASGTVLLKLHGNYKKNKTSWENSLDLGYGLMKEDGNKMIKTDDKIDLSSKYGYQATEKLYYSVLFNFRTQFTDGFDYPDRDNPISRFLAPGYVTLALGIDYKPTDYFSLLVSPLTGKLTIVSDDSLSNAGAFGVDVGSKTRTEVGAYVKTELKYEILKNVTLETKLDLFSNYVDQPQNIDVNWDMLINMKVNSFLSANLVTNLIYDNDVKFETDEGTGPRLQVKELFGLGLNVKF